MDGMMQRTASFRTSVGARGGTTLPRLVNETTNATALVRGAAAGGAAATVIVAKMAHLKTFDREDVVAGLESRP